MDTTNTTNAVNSIKQRVLGKLSTTKRIIIILMLFVLITSDYFPFSINIEMDIIGFAKGVFNNIKSLF
jgi:hypothetical protein